MRSFPTPQERFKYNLLAERINELGAFLVAARRAEPELCTEHVMVELHCAAAFLNAWHLGMAEQSCEQAECYFLAARSRCCRSRPKHEVA
jgi:hypothetical protein